MWGKPHFRVAGKIFAGCNEEDGHMVVGFKLEMKHAFAITQTPGFSPAPYVGHKGWVSMDTAAVKDWDAARALILESYRLIAPKKSLAKLDGGAVGAGGASARRTRAPRAAAAKRTPREPRPPARG